MSTIKERILQIAENKGINKETFFKNFSISYSNFKGKNLISALGSDVIVEILTEYSNISSDWLILGKGPMYLNENTASITPLEYDRVNASRPIIEIKLEEGKSNTIIADVKASAGIGMLLDNHNKLSKLPAIHLPNAPFGLNIAFQITGDSMHPRIRHSDFVAGNKIENTHDIRDGFVYIIIDKDEGVLCKRIYKNGADYRIVSDNPIYSPYLRKKTDILAFFKAFRLISEDFRPYYDDTRRDIEMLKEDMLKVKDKLNIIDLADHFRN